MTDELKKTATHITTKNKHEPEQSKHGISKQNKHINIHIKRNQINWNQKPSTAKQTINKQNTIKQQKDSNTTEYDYITRTTPDIRIHLTQHPILQKKKIKRHN